MLQNPDHSENGWHACVCVESFQLYATLCHPMDRSPPCPSNHGIPQARTLDWAAVSSCGGSSRFRDWTHVCSGSCIGGRILHHWATWDSPKWVACDSKSHRLRQRKSWRVARSNNIFQNKMTILWQSRGWALVCSGKSQWTEHSYRKPRR